MLPEQGWSHQRVIEVLDSYRQNDANWRDGRTFSLVYHAGDEVKAS